MVEKRDIVVSGNVDDEALFSQLVIFLTRRDGHLRFEH